MDTDALGYCPPDEHPVDLYTPPQSPNIVARARRCLMNPLVVTSTTVGQNCSAEMMNEGIQPHRYLTQNALSQQMGRLQERKATLPAAGSPNNTKLPAVLWIDGRPHPG